MTAVLTEADARFAEAMREVVAKKPAGYTYPQSHRTKHNKTCQYVFRGKPSCLIGQALVKVGVTVDELRKQEGDSAREVLNRLTDVSDAVRFAATSAQRFQDGGLTWADALARFEAVLAEELA